MTRRLGRRLVKAGADRILWFIVSRPALDAFLRRQLYRFPGLAGRLRMAVARSRRPLQNLPLVLAEEADLTDSARLVLQDLVRATGRSAKPDLLP